MEELQPLTGEVRIRVTASGVNPGDVKKRQDAYGYGMPYPRITPHSDGAGTVDAVGEGVSQEWIGRRLWCHGAQTYRPFGTTAEYTLIPVAQAIPLPPKVSFEQGAVSVFPASLRIGRFTWQVQLKAAPCWCKVVQERLGFHRSTRTSSGSTSHRDLPL